MESEIKKETVSEPVKKSEPTKLEKLKEELETLKIQKEIDELKNPKVEAKKPTEGITINHYDKIKMDNLTPEENKQLFDYFKNFDFSKEI